MKSPVLAAILNFVTIGLGYVYAGEGVLVGLLLTLGGGVLLRYEELRLAPLASGHFYPHWIPLISGLSLVGIGTAIDAYRKVSARRGKQASLA